MPIFWSARLYYCVWFSALNVLAGVLGSREAGGVLCVENELNNIFYTSISKPPARGPVPGPGINYTGPREVLLEFVILVF